MSHISANDLKIRGVAAIEAVLSKHAEAIVSVRGKNRFVVMDMAHNPSARMRTGSCIGANPG